MANSSTTTSCSILFLILLSSLHVHARDSQFFSKVTNSNNNNAKVTTTQVIPTKEDDPLNKPDFQDPNFVPQDDQNSGNYGLYGHESGQLPPYTATEKEAEGVFYHEDNRQYYPTTSTENNNNNIPHYYNSEAYVTEPQGMSDTKFMQKLYNTPTSNFNDNYYNEVNNRHNNNNNNDRQPGLGESKFGATSADIYNNEKKGMSDTRFLENGKYFYDLNNENNYNNNLYANNYHENSRGFESRNQYYQQKKGNYGNSFGSKGEYYNNNGQYGNNENSYEENNYSNEGYNQKQYQEFQDNSQNEQYQP